MYAACNEHIENVIDQYVDEHQLSPDLYRLADAPETPGPIPAHCHFCSRPPVYLLF